MTKFLCNFWQRGDKSGPIVSKNAKDLRELSQNIKAFQDVVFKDTYNAFLKHVLNEIRLAMETNNTVAPFVTNHMFTYPVDSVKIFDQRANLIYPIILAAMKSQNPIKKHWEELPANLQQKYNKQEKWAVPTFAKIKALMVSFQN